MLGSCYSAYHNMIICLRAVCRSKIFHAQSVKMAISFNSSLVVLEYLPAFGVLMGIWVENTLSLASVGCLYKV